jgi:PhnB protein
MNTLNPYIFFGGNCAEAMRFYAQALGGKLDLMMHAQAPAAAQSPPGSEHLVMHARLAKGDFVLMASDDMPGNYQGMKGFSLSVVVDSVAEARRIFDALAAGGEVTMPFGKTFWAEAFGMLRDRFGTPWMVNGGLQPM